MGSVFYPEQNRPACAKQPAVHGTQQVKNLQNSGFFTWQKFFLKKAATFNGFYFTFL